MTKTIGISGLGWLGLPLAQKLSLLGYKVRGTVTTSDKANTLNKKGFDAYEVFVTEQGVHGEPEAFLKNIDLLVVMVPPGLRRHSGADYVLKMSHFLNEIEKAEVSKCIFISSTSVYGDEQGMVTENDTPKPDTEAGRQLLQVEQLFFSASFETSIVRFGGLIGGSRQPVRFLAGRNDLSGGNAPVNLIHREDCLDIICSIIKKDVFGHIFNAVHPDHPKKADYYSEKAKELGLSPPHYREEDTPVFKEVHSNNVPKLLDYKFKSPI